ncbi:M4 family metallopeptidase [Acaricomes phytoseiuli]|uniref:M4 family metallopeptidase n=2 Tax=Acaricomes phytoseiuli TaxID=291968 RepID=UPI00037AADD8|nr:M4 family metallopeptidase [Acaricomes phytoseiuli]
MNRLYDAFGDTTRLYETWTTSGPLNELMGTDNSWGPEPGDQYGKAIRAVARYCGLSEVDIVTCPMRNAFWNPSTKTMGFGEAMAVDDVAAHELTHGVTQATSGPIYRGQSGAINESMSDLFGELVDMTNGSVDDTVANRWKVGEGSALGIIRDMADPTAHRQPDSMISPYYEWPREVISVHTNSGVGNKTAFLIADGGDFGGESITGLGLRKTAQLYWTVQTLLPENADYAFLGAALRSACQQNAIMGTAGFQRQDCEQVAKATQATRLGWGMS